MDLLAEEAYLNLREVSFLLSICLNEPIVLRGNGNKMSEMNGQIDESLIW